MAFTGHSSAVSTRPTTPTGSSSPPYDLICIGFGPAQLATAIANRESRKPANILFLEKKQSFSWHPSSHLPRTRMGNAFVYDLATPRNPRSAFSYTSYLLAQGRLIEFANSDRLNPLREEFEHYLKWCASQFKEQVRYQHDVVGVIPEKAAGMVKGWNVAVKDGSGRSHLLRTTHLLTPSPAPRGPGSRLLADVDFEAGQRIISFDDYLEKRNELRGPREPRLDISVVGSGQQAIEILDDLLTCPRLGNITVVTDNDSLAPLRTLGQESSPPQPRLCSIWARDTSGSKSTTSEASELIQTIYGRAYEKQVASKGQYVLRVVIGNDTAEAMPKSGIVIAENAHTPLSGSGLYHGLDALVLGCRQKGDSLDEVQFKRGAVDTGCRMWMMSARSEGGRSLAKDVAVRAGEVVKAVQAAGNGNEASAVMINARI